MVALGAVREVHHRQARRDEHVGVAAAAGGDVDRLDVALAQRRRGHLDGGRGARQPVALEEALDGGLHVALGVAGRLGERVDHLAHDLARARVVEAARLELDEAALRHHVRGRAALDAADVRGRLGVDPADLHRGDRAARRRDRVVTRLGADAGVRGLALEARLERVVGRRREHDLADRRGVVEDVAEVGAQARLVEGLRPLERLLLAGREQDLDAGGGLAVAARSGARRP